MCEQDALGLLGLDVDLNRDRVRAVADVRRNRFGNLRATWVIDVAVAWLGELGALGREDLERIAVLERKRLVAAGFCPPEPDQLLKSLGMLVGEIVAFGRVVLGVKQLPALGRVMGPHVRC